MSKRRKFNVFWNAWNLEKFVIPEFSSLAVVYQFYYNENLTNKQFRRIFFQKHFFEFSTRNQFD